MKKWLSTHWMEIVFYAVVGAAFGFTLYLGYKIGYEEGFDKGFKEREWFETWRLIKEFHLEDAAKKIAESGFGIQLGIFSTTESPNPDLVDPEIMKVLADRGFPMDMDFYNSVKECIVAIKPLKE